jgi:HSP20 family molecular chaperone IbpA
MPDGRPSHPEVVDATAETRKTMRTQSVPVNVYTTPGAMVVVCPMPAVTADDITIELRPGSVRFWAPVRSAPPRQYLIHEWEYGGYERELEVPDGYGAGVEATLANGQLAIRVLAGSPTGQALTAKPTAL